MLHAYILSMLLLVVLWLWLYALGSSGRLLISSRDQNHVILKESTGDTQYLCSHFGYTLGFFLSQNLPHREQKISEFRQLKNKQTRTHRLQEHRENVLKVCFIISNTNFIMLNEVLDVWICKDHEHLNICSVKV